MKGLVSMHALKQLRHSVFTVLFTGSVYFINDITCTLHIHTYSMLLHTVKCTILSLLLLLSTLTDTMYGSITSGKLN